MLNTLLHIERTNSVLRYNTPSIRHSQHVISYFLSPCPFKYSIFCVREQLINHQCAFPTLATERRPSACFRATSDGGLTGRWKETGCNMWTKSAFLKDKTALQNKAKSILIPTARTLLFFSFYSEERPNDVQRQTHKHTHVVFKH